MPIDLSKIAKCKIHPAIGIARVGNHPTEFFIGPETPRRNELPDRFKSVPAGAAGGATPKLKRQAARFRVFAYDAGGVVLGELTSVDAAITWKVHLVNAKAEWDIFDGRTGEKLPLDQRRPGQQRNTEVARDALIIDGGVRSVSTNQKAEFSGSFQGQPVALGEVQCGSDGRLLVLGGFGDSATVNGSIIHHYANNDGWRDDVSDGSVSASVRLSNGTTLEAAGAWVIVAPPDFAPAITNVVTLWDVVLDVATNRGLLPVPSNPSFTKDVYPILSRALLLEWVNDLAMSGHGPGGPGDFSTQWTVLADNSAAALNARKAVFRHVRDPRLLEKFVEKTATPAEQTLARNQARLTFMPALSGDSGDSSANVPDTWLTLTPRQYDILTLWKDGRFQSDWAGIPPTPPATITPEGLDRAALENGVGGAFFPGIECGWVIRHPEIYVADELVRLDSTVNKPGDMTKRMAVPWQADFFECQQHWWPSQRPDSVIREDAFQQILQLDQQIGQAAPGSAQRTALEQQRANLLAQRTPWWPDAWPQNGGSVEHKGDRAMVDRWHKLGVIVPRQSSGATVFVSTEFDDSN
jgi:hypothetical protein